MGAKQKSEETPLICNEGIVKTHTRTSKSAKGIILNQFVEPTVLFELESTLHLHNVAFSSVTHSAHAC